MVIAESFNIIKIIANIPTDARNRATTPSTSGDADRAMLVSRVAPCRCEGLVGCTAMPAAVLAVGCVAVAAGIVAAARSVAACLVVAAGMAAAADTAVVEHHAAYHPAVVDWAAMTAETQEVSRITAMFPSMAKLFVSIHGTAVHIVLIRSLIGDVARS